MAQPLPASREFITSLLNSLPATSAAAAAAAAATTNAATNTTASNPLDSAPEQVKKQLLGLHVLFPNEFLPALDLLDRRLVTRFRIQSNPELTTKDAPQAKTAPRSDAAPESRMDGHVPDEHAGVKHAIGDASARPREPSAETRQFTNAQAHTQSGAETPSAGSPVPHGEEGSANVAQTAGRGERVASRRDGLNTVYYVRSAQQRSSRFSTSYDSVTSYEVRLQAWNCSCPAFAFSAFPAVHPEPPVLVDHPSEELPWHGGPHKRKNDGSWSFGGISLGDGTPPICKHLLASVLAERCPGMFEHFIDEREVSVEEAAGWAAGWGD